MKKVVFLLAILLLAVSCSKPQSFAPNSPASQQIPLISSSSLGTSLNSNAKPSPYYVKYSGAEGKNALELLKIAHKIETKNYPGVGEFVESIDGVKGDSKHFWEFFVNGKSSNVGAGSFITKNGDIIEWKLSELK